MDGSVGWRHFGDRVVTRLGWLDGYRIIAMVRACLRTGGWLLGRLACACALIPAQQQQPTPAQLTESGHILVAGHPTPYLIRHLPVSSFPELPTGEAARSRRPTRRTIRRT